MAQRGKREQMPERQGHPLRIVLIVLLILVVLAAAGFFALGPGRELLPALPWGTSGEDAGTSASVSGEPGGEPEQEAGSVSADSGEEAVVPLPEQVEPDEPDTETVPEETGTTVTPEDNLLLLVNKDNPLPEGYEVELTELSNGETVGTVIYPDLQEMFNDARAQGVYPVVASGYRTEEKQQSLMDEKIASLMEEGFTEESAAVEAAAWVNPVGYSEHQTGLAVDINADGIQSAGYEVYEWLAENAWQYGFILRYPEDKTDLTGTEYEPWHYRYVGREKAEEIYRSGLCLEEYLGQA